MRHRRGVTLAELLVALAAGGVILAAAASVYAAQERIHRALAADLWNELAARDPAAVLPPTLRAADPVAGDFVVASDTALELEETIASAVACAVGRGSIELPADSDDGATLAAYLARPDVGDRAWLLVAGDSGSGGPRWVASDVAAVSGGGSCDVAAPFGGAASWRGALRLTLTDDPTSLGAAVGAPVRLTRRARWSVYRAADGAWYLGYRARRAGLATLATVQPVSGPYAAPSDAAPPFRYQAADGRRLGAGDPPALVARVELSLRPAPRAGTWWADDPRLGAIDLTVTPRLR